MDKTRHPHVIRTWTVERTRVLNRQTQPANQLHPSDNFRRPGKRERGPKRQPPAPHDQTSQS